MSATHKLAAVATVTQGSAFYDPMEHIGNLIKTPALLKDVQSSLCWYIDTAYVRELRSLFWAIFRNDVVHSHDVLEYNEFAAAMAEREFNEYVTSQQGFDSNSGPTVVRQLARLRHAWYDELNLETPVPTLADLLADEKPGRVNVMQRSKLEVLAKAMADEDEELEKVLLTSLIKREEDQARFSHANRQRVNPCLETMAGFLERTDTSDEPNFWDLPMPIQKRLTECVVNIINNSILKMSRDRRMDVMEFSTSTLDATRTLKAVKAVLATPRFASVEL